RVGVRLVPGVDDRPLQGRLEADLHLEVVGPLAELEPVVTAVLADPDTTGAAHDLAADEERREVSHDVAEPPGARHQVGLVGAGPWLSVLFLYRLIGVAPGVWAAIRAASSITCSPALSHRTTSSGVVTSGVEYSGWAWSTYSRAPLVRITFASPRSSSVSWLGSASWRLGSNPRASRRGDSSSKSHRARRALMVALA